MYGLTIHCGDNVAANQTRFFRRPVWCLGAAKGDANTALSHFKIINSGIGFRCRKSHHTTTSSSRHSRYLLDDGCKSSCGHEENEQTDEHPGGTANATTAFADATALWD